MPRYTTIIDRHIDRADLDYALENTGAKYSLLSYAAVIAEVLSGLSLLNKKAPGFKRVDIGDRLERFDRLVKDCRRLADDPVIGFFDDSAAQLKSSSKKLEEISGKFRKLANWAMDFSLFTGLAKKTRPIQKTNQIAILWIPGMRDESKYIRWEDIIELMYWFKLHLAKTSYSREITPEKMDKKTIQTLYAKTKKKADMALKFSVTILGVPGIYGNKPMILVSQAGGGARVFPIDSIKFYTDKILTYFSFENMRLVRITEFNKYGPRVSLQLAPSLSRERSEDTNLELTIP